MVSVCFEMQKPLDCSQEVKRFNSYGVFPRKINVPSFQRDLNRSHVKDLREHIRYRHNQRKEPIFGALDIAKYNNESYIIDGNHRLNALKEEYEENGIIVPFNCVIYTAETKEDLLEIFQSRNKGLPVPDFILNPEAKNRNLLNEIQNYVSKMPLFGSSSRRPYINLTSFMNGFAESKLSGLVSSLDDFKKILVLMNQFACDDSRNPKICDLAPSTIQKCRDNKNYLGIYKYGIPCFNDNFDLKIFENLIPNRQQPLNDDISDFYIH